MPVWWSTAHTYKNAITNQLFLYVSADGYLRGGGQTYLDNANKVRESLFSEHIDVHCLNYLYCEVWNWLSASGMRNSQGLWNDGLTDTCVNNGQVRNPVSCCTIIYSKDTIYEPDDMDVQSGLCLPLDMNATL